MTKAKSKPCMCCKFWDGGCSKGHKPRFYKQGGLRRVCNDFDVPSVEAEPHWLNGFMKIFGFRRVV